MNQELTNNPFNPLTPPKAFDEIKVSLASPERILSWSFGEIKKPETINYRTFKPERDGLFCARIFGPIKDYECLCGKYKRMKYRGVVCEKCGVEVTLQKVRRERMGHIELAAPVAHIWFLKSLPSRIGLMLDMTLRDLERILYFENYVVIEPGLTDLSYGQLMSEEEFLDAQDAYGSDAFSANIGAEAIREMLANIDLEAEANTLREELKEATGELKPKKIIKRLKIVESFLDSGNRPEWMVLTVIPVIPPELRPLVPLDGGRFATSDLNDLYRRVINRNNRLKRLIELRAPDIIVRNEKRMLQEAVDALFDNGRRGRVITGANKRPLKSLSDMLKGKQGRFRQNLLGKRVDFSGRSVIVTGPELKLHQCGLPKKMALELFKPFIYHKLELYGYATTIKAAKRMVEKERPEVWDILEEVIREHPVLLNRAPTLHRLGIQAFEPVLIEGKAIQLHPLVCAAFNADFDGDQMAVHVPLSLEAQLEARVLMMSTNNILSPANGKPIIVPSQDIVLGLYYLSYEVTEDEGEVVSFDSKKSLDAALESGDVVFINSKDASTPVDLGSLTLKAINDGEVVAHRIPAFSSIDEVEQALHAKAVTLHTRIKARLETVDEEGNSVTKRVLTTPGRLLLGRILPKHPNVPFELVNRLLTKREVSDIIDMVYRHCGQKETVIFADRMMGLGFSHACKAGISFGKDDLIIPDLKGRLVGDTTDRVKEFEQQYQDGLITKGEKYNKVVDAWTRCTDDVADAMMDEMQSRDETGKINSVYMMAHSGARGSAAQIRQLAGMRGLMAKPSGEIIERPITSNFREGLTVLEYFISTHGARKGLADTALKTADSGYLTRKLVDAAQDVIITEEDCGTVKGIVVQPIYEGDEEVVDLKTRIIGRTSCETIKDPVTGKVVIKSGHIVDEATAAALEHMGVEQFRIRSVLTCESKRGCCAKCYGRNLANGKLVHLGEAVGIIAAQSIGEPGTQLTMRTFHIGGTASQTFKQPIIKAKHDGTVRYVELRTVTSTDGNNIVLNKNGFIGIYNDKDGRELERHSIVIGSVVSANDGGTVKKGEVFVQWDPYNLPILTEKPGTVEFRDMIPGLSVKREVDEATGITGLVVIEHKEDLHPQIVVVDDQKKIVASYSIPAGAHVVVADNRKVEAGQLLAKTPRKVAKTKDITGGLPRVAELFEARKPKDSAEIAKIDGIVKIEGTARGKRRLLVLDPEAKEEEEHLIPMNKHIIVADGDRVKKGSQLTEGPVLPHEILAVCGPAALQEHLLNEVQEVYRLQGVEINDKHIEIIIRQMLRKVKITDPGDTTLLWDDKVERTEFDKENERITKLGGKSAEGEPVLLGITRASLSTESFISAASFQDTTRVLTDAATLGKVDMLRGFKENVIMGHLVPAGTGFQGARDIEVVQVDLGEELAAAAENEKEAG